METSLTITDVTRMGGQRVCVAGVDLEGKTVRPVFVYGGIMEDWLYKNEECVIRPFAQVKLNLLENRPHPPHTEDWVIAEEKPSCEKNLDLRERRAFLQEICDPNVAGIFNVEIHHDQGYYILTGEGERSLGTIYVRFLRAVKHSCYQDKWDYRLGFDDCAGGTYWLGVTDLSFRYYLDFLRKHEQIDCAEIEKQLTRQLRASAVYLRIGLARGWRMYPDRCYLQVTGIYSFPDYLEGKCFADYTKQQAHNQP